MPTMATNPYSHSRTEGEFDVPDYPDTEPGSYATDNNSAHGGQDAPYNDMFGWAPSLRISPESTPDPYRVGTEPLRDRRGGTDPDAYYAGLDADDALRHSVEFQDADGWTETKDFPGYPSAQAGANRWARNPRENPSAEPRLTQQMAARTYTFTRPFAQGLAKMGARYFDGIHFSMADHRREYDVLGMEPVKTRRNTYRIEPSPWDNGLTDMPPVSDTGSFQMEEVVPAVDVAYQSRSWRL